MSLWIVLAIIVGIVLGAVVTLWLVSAAVGYAVLRGLGW